MLNIVDLERRWIKYKIKSYLPYTLVLLFALLILWIAFVTLAPQDRETKEIQASIAPHQEAPKEVTYNAIPLIKKPIMQETVINSPEKIKPTLKSENFKMQPSLNFVAKMQDRVPTYPDTSTIQKKPKVIKNVVPKPKEKVKKEEHQIMISKRETKDDIKNIITRFKKNNNPALSLFVAKKYYELDNYTQAYNYALITNQINSDIEASWIIFAKSLVKLGKKKQAIQTLQKYISASHSNSAELLLKEIQSGKFR